MPTEYIVWDRLHSGFVHPEPGMITHHPMLAKTFTGHSDQIIERLAPQEQDKLRYAVIYRPEDNPKHPAYTSLAVGYVEIVQIRALGDKHDTLLVKGGPRHSALAELDMIQSEHSVGFRFYWSYQNKSGDTICLNFSDSLQQAWQEAKSFAREQQCKQNATNQSMMLAFIRALNHSPLTFTERVALLPAAIPCELALHENPYHRPLKPTCQIGDQYVLEDENERQMRIRAAVRAMIKALRPTYSRRQGKLDSFNKNDIRLVVDIMRYADRIDVVGVTHQLPAQALTGGSSMMRKSSLQYQLAYHATIDGSRQVAIPPI